MSLNRGERSQTRAELCTNLALAELSCDDVARAIGWPSARVAAVFDLGGAPPRDVWLVRDYLDRAVRATGSTPHTYSRLSEQMRGAAEAWFGLLDLDEVMNGTRR